MQAGELFHEKYRIVGQLGTGGQSNVYRADEVATGRRVAIKLLHDHGDGVRFIREGRVVSRLTSPYTVRLIEFDRAESGRFFMAFEYVAGENLAQIARRDAPLPWMTVGKIARQVLESLAEAHELGIIHRDIKPSNIMLTPSGDVKVLDFGVARLEDGDGRALTETGEVLGTPRYVSPECLAGGKVTAAADVFGVGLVAWELLAGRPANDARTGADIVLRHLDPTPYRLPTEIDLPEPARRWVSQMVNKNADRRPKDAQEALDDLDIFDVAPPPVVTQYEDPYDEELDVLRTGVMSVHDEDDDDEPVDQEIDATAPPGLGVLNASASGETFVENTEPEPWRPEQLGASPDETEKMTVTPVPFQEADPTDPGGFFAPPPPQPRSTGIPQNGPLLAIPDRPSPAPAPASEPESMLPKVLVIAAIVIVLGLLLVAALT